jgi:hypothetical protein
MYEVEYRSREEYIEDLERELREVTVDRDQWRKRASEQYREGMAYGIERGIAERNELRNELQVARNQLQTQTAQFADLYVRAAGIDPDV